MSKLTGRARRRLKKLVSASKILSAALAEATMLVCLLRGRFPRKLDEAIDRYAAEEAHDAKARRALRRDIIYSKYRFGVSPEEYFRFDYPQRTDDERRRFVGDGERFHRMRAIADPEAYRILNQKAEAYRAFRPFYRRDVIELDGEASFPDFQAFFAAHDVFLVKPCNSCMGQGIYKLDGSGRTAREVFDELTAQGRLVLEELIRQAPEMAKFHPQSVNTVRVVTLNRGGEIRVMQTSVRLGTGDSVVDNGCLSAGVDPKTGVILSRGRSAHRPERYDRHPDTGVQIPGSTIARWDELLALVQQLPLVLPRQRIIGWDLALSEDGWVLIEGNTCPDIQTLAAEGVGARPLLDELTR